MLYNMSQFCLHIRENQDVIKKKRKKHFNFFLFGIFQQGANWSLETYSETQVSCEGVLRCRYSGKLTLLRCLTPRAHGTRGRCVCWHIVKLWSLHFSGYEIKDCSAEPSSSDVIFIFCFKDHMYLSLTSKTVPPLCLSGQPSSSHATVSQVPRSE